MATTTPTTNGHHGRHRDTSAVAAMAVAVLTGAGGCVTHRVVTWEEVEDSRVHNQTEEDRAPKNIQSRRDSPHSPHSPHSPTDSHAVRGDGPPTHPIRAVALLQRPTAPSPQQRPVRLGPLAPLSSSPPPAAGPLIDGALQEFLNARARARAQPKTSGAWGEAWEQALGELAAATALPPRGSDLGAFVRARVVLEVELQRDLSRDILLPNQLSARVHNILLAVDESVDELRAAQVPGTIKPPPRLGDEELVLRAPVSPLVISSPFGVRSDPFTGASRFHAGIDVDAPEGTPVYAASSGLVVYAGTQGGYGKQVVIDHGDGVRSHYSHLSAILVEPGQTVDEGDAVAQVGSTGRSTGPHLHFAVTNADGDFLDPAAVLDIPWASIADQVKLGPSKSKQSFTLVNQGDTVQILAPPR